VKTSEVDDEIYSDQIKEEQNEEEFKISFDNQSIIGSVILNRVKQCPKEFCGKNNVKIAQDNWIVCNACNTQYCFLCGNTLKGAQHFDKRCVRYTPVK